MYDKHVYVYIQMLTSTLTQQLRALATTFCWRKETPGDSGEMLLTSRPWVLLWSEILRLLFEKSADRQPRSLQIGKATYMGSIVLYVNNADERMDGR